MPRTGLVTLLIAAAAACALLVPGSAAAAQTLDSLSNRLHARTSAAPGTVAVVLVDLGNGKRLRINENVRMHAASTMKVPVMFELYRQAAANRLSLSDSIRITNRFTSIADGSSYALSAEADSDERIYRMIGEEMTVRALNHRMITRSSNLATNILIQIAGAERAMETMRAIGAGGMHVLRGVEDIPAYRRGMNNTTTAAAFARVLEVLARCASPDLRQDLPARAASITPQSCRDMVNVLADQQLNSMIPAGLPTGVRVAHKTGSITEIHHDGGIIYPEHRAPYVLVVMTRGIEDPEQSADVVAELSRIVWRALAGEEDTGGEPNKKSTTSFRSSADITSPRTASLP